MTWQFYVALTCAVIGFGLSVWLVLTAPWEEPDWQVGDEWQTPESLDAREHRERIVLLHAKAGAHQKRAGQQKANWK